MQKTAYEMRISDWSSDVCSSDLLQRAACERAGSALYARIIDAMVDDVRTGGVCAGVLAPWAGNAMADAIPLRFPAAVHTLVLTGEAPGLAEHYPSAGGSDARSEEHTAALQ